METRANFVLIGAFTVAGILGLLAFLLWLAQYQVDRQYDYYDVMFTDVSGLSQAADVRFNGLSVGRVVSMELAEGTPSLVAVRIEVEADTPVKRDTVVKLQAQGVTGISFVSLSGGSVQAPTVEPPEGGGPPVLIAQRSVVEQLTEDGPDLITEAVALLRDLRGFASQQNRENIADILRNVQVASKSLETAITDFSDISESISRATGDIAQFTSRLDPVARAFEITLDDSRETLGSATTAFDEAVTTLQTATRTLEGVDTLVREDGAVTMSELRGTATELRQTLASIGGEAESVLAEYRTTARQATARLEELEGTLAAIEATTAEANVALESVDSASISFEQLVDGDGAVFVAESRATLRRLDTALVSVNRMLATDVPDIVADVGSAIETARLAVEQVAADVTTLSDDAEPLLQTADEGIKAAIVTLENANTTLSNIDGAMIAAERTLTTANGAVAGLETIIDEEAAPTAREIRTASARISTAVEQIAADLPAAAADLRQLMGDASRVMARIDKVVADAAGPVGRFTETGLPEFTMAGRELRQLILQLERIAGRLEQDPARFLLGGGAPQYRR